MLQTCTMGRALVTKILKRHGLVGRPIGEVTDDDQIRVSCGDRLVFSESRSALHRLWSETTWQMQTLRDNPESALQEYDRILDTDDPGLSPALTFDPTEDVAAPLRRPPGPAPAWRSCASRASTGTWRWPPPSIGRASTRSTCT